MTNQEMALMAFGEEKGTTLTVSGIHAKILHPPCMAAVRAAVRLLLGFGLAVRKGTRAPMKAGRPAPQYELTVLGRREAKKLLKRASKVAA
jgi:hypothetical protein